MCAPLYPELCTKEFVCSKDRFHAVGEARSYVDACKNICMEWDCDLPDCIGPVRAERKQNTRPTAIKDPFIQFAIMLTSLTTCWLLVKLIVWLLP